MDRHARWAQWGPREAGCHISLSLSRFSRRRWRENAPSSRPRRSRRGPVSLFRSPHHSWPRISRPKPTSPLTPPNPSQSPYCRAVLSRQSWPRNAISMGFFWGGPVPKPPLYRPRQPSPSLPVRGPTTHPPPLPPSCSTLFSDGHSILALSLSLLLSLSLSTCHTSFPENSRASFSKNWKRRDVRGFS